MSDYTARDKMVRFFTELEDQATINGDWSRVDMWRSISHWLEENVCRPYETELEDTLDKYSVLDLEEELSLTESRLEASDGRVAKLEDEIDKLQNELSDVRHANECLEELVNSLEHENNDLKEASWEALERSYEGETV